MIIGNPYVSKNDLQIKSADALVAEYGLFGSMGVSSVNLDVLSVNSPYTSSVDI